MTRVPALRRVPLTVILIVSIAFPTCPAQDAALVPLIELMSGESLTNRPNTTSSSRRRGARQETPQQGEDSPSETVENTNESTTENPSLQPREMNDRVPSNAVAREPSQKGSSRRAKPIKTVPSKQGALAKEFAPSRPDSTPSTSSEPQPFRPFAANRTNGPKISVSDNGTRDPSRPNKFSSGDSGTWRIRVEDAPDPARMNLSDADQQSELADGNGRLKISDDENRNLAQSNQNNERAPGPSPLPATIRINDDIYVGEIPKNTRKTRAFENESVAPDTLRITNGPSPKSTVEIETRSPQPTLASRGPTAATPNDSVRPDEASPPDSSNGPPGLLPSPKNVLNKPKPMATANAKEPRTDAPTTRLSDRMITSEMGDLIKFGARQTPSTNAQKSKSKDLAGAKETNRSADKSDVRESPGGSEIPSPEAVAELIKNHRIPKSVSDEPGPEPRQAFVGVLDGRLVRKEPSKSVAQRQLDRKTVQIMLGLLDLGKAAPPASPPPAATPMPEAQSNQVPSTDPRVNVPASPPSGDVPSDVPAESDASIRTTRDAFAESAPQPRRGKPAELDISVASLPLRNAPNTTDFPVANATAISEIATPGEIELVAGVGNSDQGRGRMKPIGALTASVSPPPGELPPNQASERFSQEGEFHSFPGECRPWGELTKQWEAPGTFHRPLYFEDINLERHGYTYRVFQPAVSAAHFFGTIPALPYLMVAEQHGTPTYTLGHYRPGSYAPYMWHRPPASLRGALAESGVATGMILLIP